MAIVQAMGRDRRELKLEFHISNASTDGDLNSLRGEVYMLLAKDRGEVYAKRVLSGQELPTPRKNLESDSPME